MHRAPHYLSGRFAPKVRRAAVEAYVLTPADAGVVSAALPADANDYYYSALMSILDGLRAIDTGFFTWSTVKMYYAVFYSIRAILAWQNVVVFRPDEAPFYVEGVAGAIPTLIEGKGSHKSMLNCFRKLRPTHYLLSMDIDLIDGLAWMLEKRESANYKMPRFCEPVVPEHYADVTSLGVRKAVAAYLDPKSGILPFDRDHAIVAFPLAALRAAGNAAVAAGGADAGKEELDFLVRKCRERSGAATPLLTYFRSTLKE